jgi:nuclear transport factor 2 (NTF2) superfamily protein
MTEEKPPLPRFTRETAAQKVQAAEDAWTTREPARPSRSLTPAQGPSSSTVRSAVGTASRRSSEIGLPLSIESP